MKSKAVFEYIEHYLNGMLVEKERLLFEELLANDSEMRVLVEQQKVANQLLMENRLRRLKNTMKEDMRSGMADKMITRQRIVKGLWWGGLGVLILIFSVSILWNDNSQGTKKVYQNKAISEEKTTSSEAVLPSVSEKSYKDKVIASSQKNYSGNDKKEGNFMPSQNDSVQFAPLTEKNREYIPEAKENAILKASVPEPMNICENVVILISGKATETCQDKQEGVLDLSVRGGNAPYKCDLYEMGSRETLSYSKDNAVFSQLEAGRYRIMVTDKNGCKGKSEEFVINAKKCREENIEEYSFKPEYNEQFKFLAEEAGILVIYDRAGKEQWNEQLYKNEELIWDGTNRNGKLVEKGIYLFVVTYKTGNSKKGYITVY